MRGYARRFWKIFIEALREIFDESAYARFLTRREMLSSPTAYAEFIREIEQSRARCPRCC